MMERLMKKDPYKKQKNGSYNPLFVTKLVQNYRNHEAILRIPNKMFYDNELIACGNREIIHAFSKPIIFYDIEGEERKILGSTRYLN